MHTNLSWRLRLQFISPTEMVGFRAANRVCTERQPTPASTAHKEHRALEHLPTEASQWQCRSCSHCSADPYRFSSFLLTLFGSIWRALQPCASRKWQSLGWPMLLAWARSLFGPSGMKTKRSTSGAIDGSFCRQNVEASRKTKHTWFSTQEQPNWHSGLNSKPCVSGRL
jgi:hypothetical protein